MSTLLHDVKKRARSEKDYLSMYEDRYIGIIYLLMLSCINT